MRVWSVCCARVRGWVCIQAHLRLPAAGAQRFTKKSFPSCSHRRAPRHTHHQQLCQNKTDISRPARTCMRPAVSTSSRDATASFSPSHTEQLQPGLTCMRPAVSTSSTSMPARCAALAASNATCSSEASRIGSAVGIGSAASKDHSDQWWRRAGQWGSAAAQRCGKVA